MTLIRIFGISFRLDMTDMLLPFVYIEKLWTYNPVVNSRIKYLEIGKELILESTKNYKVERNYFFDKVLKNTRV